MINDRVKNGFQPQAPVGSSQPVPAAALRSANVANATPPAQGAVARDETQRTPETIDRSQLEAAASKLSEYAQSLRRNLSFAVEETTGRTVISVYDAETDELIRQIPSEEALQLAEKIQGQIQSLMRPIEA